MKPVVLALHLSLLGLSLLGTVCAAVLPPAPPPVTESLPELLPEAPSCGEPVSAPAPSRPLPGVVTGRVGFYAVLHDRRGVPLRSLALGPSSALFPLGSAFKPLVVRAALQAVDAGTLSLKALITTTPGKRSIESHPAGRNTVATLAQRALERSDNTASDLLFLGLGPSTISRAVRELSSCTSLLHSTKAWWAAQSGLAPGIFPDLVPDAVNASRLPLEERLAVAARLNARAQELTGPEVEAALDVYFHGPTYAPELEVALQNTSTPQAFTELLARVLGGDDLKPSSRRLFRAWLSKSCCQPAKPALKTVYWGHKAGSGWRLLTLTGLAELPDGRRLAYAYFNDGSNTLDAEEMELQIRPVVGWIEAALLELAQ
jgi:beta-lactamase class A